MCHEDYVADGGGHGQREKLEQELAQRLILSLIAKQHHSFVIIVLRLIVDLKRTDARFVDRKPVVTLVSRQAGIGRGAAARQVTLAFFI